jgi:hypothetical protein
MRAGLAGSACGPVLTQRMAPAGAIRVNFSSSQVRDRDHSGGSSAPASCGQST